MNIAYFYTEKQEEVYRKMVRLAFDSPFLLEMPICPVYQAHFSFQFIFLIHNGQDDSQLLAGQ